jgi:hypothetical protein
MNKNIQITCPKCGHNFNVEEVLITQVEKDLKNNYEKMKSEMEQKILSKQKEIQKKEYELSSKENNLDNILKEKLKDEKVKLTTEVKNSLRDEYEQKIQSLNNENESRRKQLLELKQKELEFQTKMREFDELKLNLELEYEKKLQEKQSEIVNNISRIEHERVELKLKEKDKQLEDFRKQIDEMKRKAEQGSMQLQGEVQELALEEMLRSIFIQDEIKEVAKGIKGADVIHIVRNKFNQDCGLILYESKRTKSFNNEWIIKLKDDALRSKADICVIVTETLPDGINKIGQIDGIWICSFNDVKGLVMVIRESLIKISAAHSSQTNKGEKIQMLYDYLTSNEFKLQLEGIIEGYHNIHKSLLKEKIAMEKFWKEREKQLERVLLNATDFYGAIKGIAGSSIPEVKLLEGDEEPLDNN